MRWGWAVNRGGGQASISRGCADRMRCGVGLYMLFSCGISLGNIVFRETLSGRFQHSPS